MPTLSGKIKSLSVTVHGGAAVSYTGGRTANVTKNFGTVFEYDPDSDVPDAYQGNKTQRLEITLRDRALAMALMANPCVDSLNMVLSKPQYACDGDTAAADSVTVAGTKLVVDGDIPAAAASTENVPQDYTLAFVVSKDPETGTKGTLTVTPAAPPP